MRPISSRQMSRVRGSWRPIISGVNAGSSICLAGRCSGGSEVIGGAGPEPIPRADVDRRGLSFTAVREHTFTNLTDPALRDGARPAVQRRRMTYRYQAPLPATLLLEYLDADGWQFLTFTVAPEDECTCRVYQTVSGPGMTDPEQAASAAKYEMSIFEEDLDLQRRALSGLEFPLDVAAELHTRADRVSVEFRRVLAAAVSG